MKGAFWLVVLVAGTAISLVGLFLGAWWLTFAAGLFVGVMFPRARLALPTGALAGLIAWALPLVLEQDRYGLGPTASSLAAIMGYTGQSTIPVVLTCAVGVLLGMTGAWLGSATRRLAVPA